MKKPQLLPSLAFCRLSSHSVPKYCNQFHLHLRHDVRQETIPHQSTNTLFAGSSSSEDNNAHQDEQEQQQDPSMFYELMSPITTAKPDQMSAASLAYLGDVLYELFVRSRYVWPSRRMSDLQNTVVSIVRAEAQSQLLQKFIESFPMTSAEKAVLARGRNANLTARKKGKSSNAGGGSATAYQDSTAFEALLGYAYISNKDRFNEMISWIKEEMDEQENVP